MRPDAAEAAKRRQQLLAAVKANDTKQLQSLLHSGASAAITNDRGDPLLHIACERAAAVDCVQVLLASGADIEARGYHGRTALHTAAIWNAEAALNMLLAKGASAHAADEVKQTPLYYAKTSSIIAELVRCGADIEARNTSGETPLHSVCGLNKVVAVNALIKAGAQLDTVNNTGDTALHVAA
jgi:ankyrin repeat protein